MMNIKKSIHYVHKVIESTKTLIDKLTQDGNVTKLQLVQELFGMNKEELVKILERGE